MGEVKLRLVKNEQAPEASVIKTEQKKSWVNIMAETMEVTEIRLFLNFVYSMLLMSFPIIMIFGFHSLGLLSHKGVIFSRMIQGNLVFILSSLSLIWLITSVDFIKAWSLVRPNLNKLKNGVIKFFSLDSSARYANQPTNKATHHSRKFEEALARQREQKRIKTNN